MHKLSVCAFLLVVSVYVATGFQTIGERQKGDYLTKQDSFKKVAKIHQVVSGDKTFRAKNGEKISQVLLFDRNEKGFRASARVTGGGPGQDYIDVHFESQKDHDIDYAVSVFAKKA